MKASVLATMSLAMALTAACSSGSDGKGSGATPQPGQTSEKLHQVSECPWFRGEQRYETDGGRVSKDIKVEDAVNGVRLSDTGNVFLIDGQRRDFARNDEGKVISYTGVCSKQTIIIDIFLGDAFKGKMTYTWPDAGRLTIHLQDEGRNETRTYMLRR